MPRLEQRCTAPGCSYKECPGQGRCALHGGIPRPDPPRTSARAPIDDVRARCAARRRDGGPCWQPAVKGATVCRLHGASAPQVRAAAADAVVAASIVAETERYTTPVPTTAREALEAELARTAGAIDYLRSQLERYDEPRAEWVALYQAERQHLARFADRMATFEQRTAEVEANIRGQLLDQLQTALAGILADLGHDPDAEETRGIVAVHLRRAAGMPAATAAARPETKRLHLAVPPPPPAAF